MLKSKRPSSFPKKFKNTKELVILANGPSLNGTVSNHKNFLIQKLFASQDISSADYVSFAFPDGQSTIKSHLGLYAEFATVNALRRVANSTTVKLFHEHITLYLYNPDSFNIELLSLHDYLLNRTDIQFILRSGYF